MDNQKILIVDDEPDMRIFVSTVVETLGFVPITAKNGVEALEKARSAVPVLVILDVMTASRRISNSRPKKSSRTSRL
jgi:CheY-like chemotaxis protein